MNPIAIRLLNQQLIAPQYNEPAEVVSHMGAMQAQEYRMMRWAVEMRTRRPSAKTFKQAFDSGRIICLHLMRFTHKYFKSRQPATLEDFVWWSGLNISECRKGIALLGDSIHVEKWQDREFYLTDDCRTRGFRKGKFLLIPSYDEYLISYKSRDIVLPPEHKHYAHNNNGIFQPIIAYDGTICGNWTPFKDNCQATFFEDAFCPQNIIETWQAYKVFCNR